MSSQSTAGFPYSLIGTVCILLLLPYHHTSSRFRHGSFLIWRCGKNCIETWLCRQITSHRSSQLDAASVVIEVVKPGTCKPRNDDHANRKASLAARYLISNKEDRTCENRTVANGSISATWSDDLAGRSDEWSRWVSLNDHWQSGSNSTTFGLASSTPHDAEISGLPEAYHFPQPSAPSSPILAISESHNSSSSEIRGMFESAVIKENALNVGARMTAPILTVQLAPQTYPSPFLWILPTIHSMSQPWAPWLNTNLHLCRAQLHAKTLSALLRR